MSTAQVLEPLVPRQALDQVVARELSKVRHFLLRRLGPRDDLDDLVQTVFVELCGSIGRYRGESSLSTFIGGFTMMIALRALRPSAWHRRRDCLESEPVDLTSRPHDLAIAREQMRRLHSILAQLAPPKRRALILAAVDGKSAQEIARLTGSTVPAVRSRVFYARRELQERAKQDPYLKDLFGDDGRMERLPW